MVKHPFFWALTIAGNAIILLGSFLLHTFEANSPPQTLYGKWTIVVLMAAGTHIVWSYMAFLATDFIAPDLSHLEKDAHEMEKITHGLETKKHS